MPSSGDTSLQASKCVLFDPARAIIAANKLYGQCGQKAKKDGKQSEHLCNNQTQILPPQKKEFNSYSHDNIKKE